MRTHNESKVYGQGERDKDPQPVAYGSTDTRYCDLNQVLMEGVRYKRLAAA